MIVNQPWDGPNARVGDILQQQKAISTRRYTALHIAVAFAKRAGIMALAEPIRQLTALNNGVEAFVGIDVQGTSREALQELLDLGVTTYIFHNPAATFHPKLYLFEGPAWAFAIIGSSNLTAGGLYTNYELGLEIELNLATPRDTVIHEELRSVFEKLRTARNTAVLTPSLLKELNDRDMLGAERGNDSIAEARTEDRVRRPSVGGLFPRTPVPPAPRRILRTAEPEEGERTDLTTGIPSQFVLLLGNRDAVRRPGYSPDIFIPLRARDAEPAFWRWNHGFVRVPQTKGSFLERRLDILVEQPIGRSSPQTGVRLYFYAERAEFRLNCGALVRQALPGDLLVIELPHNGDIGIDYIASIVKQGTQEFTELSMIATKTVPNSPKRWGYA
jgi:HKD family nuclease